MAEYLSQDSDYLDILRTKLGDLQGADTLIHELTQNAHDAYQDAERTTPASTIVFDICDDGLLVTNDGVFSSCGQVSAPECLWVESDTEHERCDFHRFRKVAAGDKAKAENVFGAFGVGFISVYQVTDQPELWSSGLHWTLNPAAKTAERILSESDPEHRPGTTFWLPWAPSTGSDLGRILRRAPVEPEDHIHALVDLGANVAERAIMFLRSIESVEIRRNGERVSLITKTESDSQLVVDRDGVACSWLLLAGDFSQYKTEADARLAGQLTKRSPIATVAIPEDPSSIEGLLFCGLPTRQPTQLPFHVDAHFFPSSDRKRIDVEGESYQVEWNLAALDAAADAVSANLDTIGLTLGHRALWSLLSGLYSQGQRTDLQEIFWTSAEGKARSGEVVYSSEGDWQSPTEVMFLQQLEEEANLPALEAIGLKLAHPDLRPHQSTMSALGVKRVHAAVVADAIAGVAPADRTKAVNAHHALAEDELRKQLGAELSQRFTIEKPDRVEQVRETLGELAVCLTLRENLTAPQYLIGAPSAAEVKAISAMGLSQVMAHSVERNGAMIRSLVPGDYVLKTCQYVVAQVQREGLQCESLLAKFFHWMRDNHVADIRESDKLQRLLTSARIWPSNGGLFRLVELTVPGGFQDTLGLAMTVDSGFAEGLVDIARLLGCPQLDVVRYAIDYVPRLFDHGQPSIQDVSELLKDLAACSSELLSSREALDVLGDLPLAPCSDGAARCPRDVLFDSADIRELLGNEAPTCTPENAIVRSLLQSLGTNDSVTVQAVVARARELSASTLNPTTRRAAQTALRTLAGLNVMHSVDTDVLAELRRLAWLPATDDDNWHRPSELLTAFRRDLFGDHGLQLDFPLKAQWDAADLLRTLECRQYPSPDEAIDYLEELLRSGKEVPIGLFKLLDRDITPGVAKRLSPLPLFLASGGLRFGPDRAFLGTHPFGDWAVTLNAEWASLSGLLEHLHIKREPDALDAARILAYIDYERGEFHEPLDSQTSAVVNACWSLIGQDPESPLLDDIRSEIEGRRTAVNAEGVLVPPDSVFFNDQPALARYLEGALGPALISRIGESWRGLALCGTSGVSASIGVEVLEAAEPQDMTEGFRESIETKRDPILRALAQDDRLAAPEALLTNWLALTCVGVTKLEVRVTMARPRLDVVVDGIQGALLDRTADTLYVVRDQTYPSAAVSRELLTGASVEAGHLPLLITALDQVLAAPDAGAAQDALDVRGFARHESSPAVAEGAACDLTDGTDVEAPESSSEEEQRATSPEERPSEKPPGAGSELTKGRKPQRREERLHSYVIAAHDENEDQEADGEARHKRNLEIDKAGTARVMAYEISKGRRPKKMTHLNKGYDVASEDKLGNVRFIEVKSTVNLWGRDGVGITPAQHEYARKNPDDWWLYVVEAAESEDDWAIYCINNFVERTHRYMFDDGWRMAAKEKAGNWKDNQADITKSAQDSVSD